MTQNKELKEFHISGMIITENTDPKSKEAVPFNGIRDLTHYVKRGILD